MATEIERKFIVSEIPKDIIPFEKKYVFQNYLSVKDKEEIRIRMQVEDGIKKYDITYKNGSGMVRDESKFRIGESIYYDLSEKIKEKPVKKYRQFYQINSQQIMVDTYLETKEPLIIAEIEFESEEDAEKFNPPNWFIKEVTYDDDFKNKNIWKKIQ